jgi:hypothetical protein
MGVAAQIFTIFFAVFFGLILTKANENWLPFTYEELSGTNQSSREIMRLILSVLMLLVMPGIYFTLVLTKLLSQPALITIPPSTVKEWLKFLLLVFLILPPHGFYCFWQLVVRCKPEKFYTDSTRARVKNRFAKNVSHEQNAFAFSAFTLFIGIFCVLPALVFWLL